MLVSCKIEGNQEIDSGNTLEDLSESEAPDCQETFSFFAKLFVGRHYQSNLRRSLRRAKALSKHLVALRREFDSSPMMTIPNLDSTALVKPGAMAESLLLRLADHCCILGFGSLATWELTSDNCWIGASIRATAAKHCSTMDGADFERLFFCWNYTLKCSATPSTIIYYCNCT